MADQKNIEIKLEFKDIHNKFTCFNQIEKPMQSDPEVRILENVNGDQGRFVSIIQNFLSNALKFTSEAGKIKVRTSLVEEQEILSEEKYENLKRAFKSSISNKKQDQV